MNICLQWGRPNQSGIASGQAVKQSHSGKALSVLPGTTIWTWQKLGGTIKLSNWLCGLIGDFGNLDVDASQINKELRLHQSTLQLKEYRSAIGLKTSPCLGAHGQICNLILGSFTQK